ncbi:MAG: outer membrane protein [Acidobacteria bacterium]|nr:outer membrane protein [Acidobacteriota bacterium]
MEATLIRTASKLSLFAILLLAMTTSAFAQATRTWVSGVGDDVNPCSRTAPCKTFAGAISKTASGGEISVLDPGGFGTVTITKPLTIDGNGVVASILAAGVPGITVNTAGAADTVTIRNLSINGSLQTANPGTFGVRIINGKNVNIEHCAIWGFNRGVFIDSGINSPRVMIRNSIVRSNTEGVGSIPTSGTPLLVIENSQIDQNVGHGVNLATNTKMSAAGSSFNFNGAGGVLAQATSTEANLTRCDLNFNANGIFAGNAGGIPQIRLHECMITGNTTNGIFLNGGTVTAFSSNVIAGNSGNNNASLTVAQQ